MSDPPRKNAPAGWYPHPGMANTQQYWDGSAWTDQVAPAAGPAAKNTGPGAVVRDLVVVVGLLVLIAMVVAVVAVLAAG